MFNFFKKKLNAKEIFFTLSKHLFSSIYELREITLNDSRRLGMITDVKKSIDNVSAESTALVYFLITSPVQLSKLPSSIKEFLLNALKGCAMSHITGLEKNESQQFIEGRFDDYYSVLEVGYNEAEICSKYLNLLGVVGHENDIIQNLSYSSFIDSLFLFSMEVLGVVNKDFKIIYTPLSKEDWASISAQSKQAASEYSKKQKKYGKIGACQVGEKVEVIDGPFSEFHGTIKAADYEKNLLKVELQIFGRTELVELKPSQVEPVEVI